MRVPLKYHVKRFRCVAWWKSRRSPRFFRRINHAADERPRYRRGLRPRAARAADGASGARPAGGAAPCSPAPRRSRQPRVDPALHVGREQVADHHRAAGGAPSRARRVEMDAAAGSGSSPETSRRSAPGTAAASARRLRPLRGGRAVGHDAERVALRREPRGSRVAGARRNSAARGAPRVVRAPRAAGGAPPPRAARVVGRGHRARPQPGAPVGERDGERVAARGRRERLGSEQGSEARGRLGRIGRLRDELRGRRNRRAIQLARRDQRVVKIEEHSQASALG